MKSRKETLQMNIENNRKLLAETEAIGDYKGKRSDIALIKDFIKLCENELNSIK